MSDNELAIRNIDPALYNDDLAPLKHEERNWGAFEIFNVWSNDIQSLFGYTLAATLFISYGLNGWAVLAGIVLAGCIVGTIAAYLVGAYLFEPVAQPLIDFFGVQQGFDDARQQFEATGMATIILIAMSPIPLVLASLGAGVVGINPLAAIGFIALTRAIRYYGMGLIAWYAAPSLRKLWQRLENPWIKWTLILVSVLALLALFML